MNKKPEENKTLDLSALDFGPSWARQGESKPRKKYAEHTGERRRDGNGGKRREGGRPPRRDADSREGRRPSNDRRGSANEGRRRAPRPQPVAAPVGLVADIMPVEEGIDNLSKEIVAAGRTYSVFDLARMILSARERYKLVFRKEEEGSELLQCKFDGAVFLTKDECLAHYPNAEWMQEIYVAEEIEVEAPKGSFQAISKCGLSGALFGPANYHDFNQNVIDQHQKSFSYMSIDEYRSKIVSDGGVEAVQAWLESMKKHVQYRPVANPTIVLADAKAMRADFEKNHFTEVFRATHRADVDSQIPAKLLSPGLLTLLKETIADQRRYPGKLAPFLCRQLSGRHLAVFKWQGKLHCGPSRAHVVAADINLADRPAALLKWITENQGAGVDRLWQALLPADVTEETKKEWFHDLHWMINQGHIILLSDGHIFTSSYSKKSKNVKKSAEKDPKKSVSKEAKSQAKPEKCAGEADTTTAKSATQDAAVEQVSTEKAEKVAEPSKVEAEEAKVETTVEAPVEAVAEVTEVTKEVSEDAPEKASDEQ